jgi:hypothetical protein
VALTSPSRSQVFVSNLCAVFVVQFFMSSFEAYRYVDDEPFGTLRPDAQATYGVNATVEAGLLLFPLSALLGVAGGLAGAAFTTINLRAIAFRGLCVTP